MKSTLLFTVIIAVAVGAYVLCSSDTSSDTAIPEAGTKSVPSDISHKTADSTKPLAEVAIGHEYSFKYFQPSDIELFTFNSDTDEYRFHNDEFDIDQEYQALASDEEAVETARKWITEHVGNLPAGATLQVEQLNHSSSGNETPKFGYNHGHTIHFRAELNGVRTEDYAIIYMNSELIISASVRLRAYSITSSKPLPVDKTTAAKTIYHDFLHSSTDTTIKQISDRLYLTIIPYNSGEVENSARTCWATPETQIYVDAMNGKFYFDD